MICLGWNLLIVFSKDICPTHESRKRSLLLLCFEVFNFRHPKPHKNCTFKYYQFSALDIIDCEVLEMSTKSLRGTESEISQRDIAYRVFKCQGQSCIQEGQNTSGFLTINKMWFSGSAKKVHISFCLLCIMSWPVKCPLIFSDVYWYIKISYSHKYLLKYYKL